MIFYAAHQRGEDRNFDYTLFLGAVLHDIGKFYMRTEDAAAKRKISKQYEVIYKAEGKHAPRHQEWSASFVEDLMPADLRSVTSLVLYHHNPSSYQQLLISVADKISAKVDRKDYSEGSPDDKSKYLISVLSQINLDEKKREPREAFYKALHKRYELEHPSETFNTDAKDDYQSLWSEFSIKVNSLRQAYDTSSLDLEDFASAIYNLVRIYTYNIPSAFYHSQPDISLWAHSKSTAAIAFCLDRQLKKEFPQQNERERVLQEINKKLVLGNEFSIKNGDYPYFCLVKGDVSGIQDFVFDTKMDGALKALKAKSFYVSFLLDTIARYILKEENMPICNLIYNGGGHFYLLMPRYFMDKLPQYQQKFDRILFDVHKGAVSIFLEALEVDVYNFAHKFGECFDEVSRNIQKKKAYKFKDIIQEKKMEFFEPWEDYDQKCPHCGRKVEPRPDGSDSCCFCESFVKLGDELMKNLFIIDSWGQEKDFSEFSNIHDVLRAFGRYIQFTDHPKRIANTLILDRSRIEDWQKNQEGIATGQGGLKSGFESEFYEDLDVSTYVPFKDGEERALMLIEDIAESAKGVKTWGIVRGDVDNLGDIFKNGLGDDTSISRIMTLSEELALFFGYYFNKLIKKQEGNLMVVYAGGDDFCILGQWDVLPQAAHAIYTEFRSFACGNPDVTLSMGFDIAPDKKYPIYRVAMVCGEHLESAKEYERKDGRKKDCFAFGTNFVDWKEFDDLKNLKEAITDIVGNNNVSKALINGIYAVCNLKKVSNDSQELFKAWRFVYFMAKLKERYSSPKNTTVEEALEEILNKIICRETNTLYKHSYLAARWAELELRR